MGWGVLDDSRMVAPLGTATLGAETNTGMSPPAHKKLKSDDRTDQIPQSTPAP